MKSRLDLSDAIRSQLQTRHIARTVPIPVSRSCSKDSHCSRRSRGGLETRSNEELVAFDAELKRSELDCASDPNAVSACDVVFDTVPEGQEPAVGSTLADLLAAPKAGEPPPPS